MTPWPSSDQSVETMILEGTPGKLVNILLRSSPETLPRIPAFRKQIKTLKTVVPDGGLPCTLDWGWGMVKKGATPSSVMQCTLTGPLVLNTHTQPASGPGFRTEQSSSLTAIY